MIGDILQPTHLLFILVIALLVLGPKRLPEAGRALGRGLRDFRMAISGEEQDSSALGTTTVPPAPAPVAPPPTEAAAPAPVAPPLATEATPPVFQPQASETATEPPAPPPAAEPHEAADHPSDPAVEASEPAHTVS